MVDQHRPNVLVLLTDQERYDLSAPDGPPVSPSNGSPVSPSNGSSVATPNIDRLRSEGIRFTNAFTPISICSSARASLLTGQYPHRHGMLNNCHGPDAIQPNVPPTIPTVGELLADAGYENTYAGKWHVGRDQTPMDFGFRYLGGSDRRNDAIDTAYEEYRQRLGVSVAEVDLEDPVYSDTPDEPLLLAATTPAPVEATRPYFIAERTIERLASVASGDGPWLHRADFLGPHHPYVVPEPYASMYDPEAIEPWPSYVESFDGKPQAHENYVSYRGVHTFDWDDWAELVAMYFGQMTLIDDQIGRILEAAAEHVSDDLVTIHASDHGDFAGAHRLFNKGPAMYDDTYRIPLHVRWPGMVDPGTTCDELVSFLDLMPTLLSIGGVDVPPGVDGRSLVPLLRGDRPADWREAVFAQFHGDEFGLYSQRMLRTKRYKFVYNAPDVNELYDLQRDPHELTNLVSHPDYDGVQRRLTHALADVMDRTNDPIAPWTTGALRRG